MTTELAPSFLDSVDELPMDLPSVTLEPARLYWYHGVDAGKIKTPGVFFGKETAFTSAPPAPWETDDRYLDTDGPGYSVARLRIAFLGWRDQWFIPGATADDKIQWIPIGGRSPDGAKVKKQIEYLILVDGLPDPMVLAVSGFYKSRPFENIIREYERGALAQLMRAKKRAFPRWSHWLTIGGKVDAKGIPIIESAKDAKGEEYGSSVTPPVMLAPPALISSDTMRLGIETWNLYNALGWFKFQRTNRDTTEAVYTVEEQRALPAGRNVPVAVTDEDLPF
jgi:hypothetical protein